MATFTGDIILRDLGINSWELMSTIEYHVGHKWSNDVIRVEPGFRTDLASIPRIFWPIASPLDRSKSAAIIHDFLYKEGRRSRKECDKIFLEGLKVLGVPFWKRHSMYRALRLFGWASWDRARELDNIIEHLDDNQDDENWEDYKCR